MRYSTANPRNLHSFPTRRSSDLETHLRRAGLLERLHGGDRRPAGGEHRVEHEKRPVLLARGDLEVVVDGLQDRKSTRLNSSHVAISYAVFCLKKKLTAVVVDLIV